MTDHADEDAPAVRPFAAVLQDLAGGRVAAYTNRLADRLQEAGAIRGDAVEHAFRSVPRHLFVTAIYLRRDRRVEVPQGRTPDADVLDFVYSDEVLVTRPPLDDTGAGMSSSSEPSLTARMLEALDLRPGARVLEIGAGTGYNAALVHAVTGAQVVTVDPTPGVAAEAAAALHRAGVAGEGGVTALAADGYHGWADKAPYDRIVATVGVAGIPAAWFDQLAPDGLVVAPVWHGGFHPILAVRPRLVPPGRGAVAASFMPAAGPLHPRHTAPTLLDPPGEPTVAPHPWRPLDDETYADLWFAAAAREPRVVRRLVRGLTARGQCALADGDALVLVQHDAIRSFHAERGKLDRRAAELVAGWADAGRPRISDWTCRFEPAADDPRLWVPAGWRTTPPRLADSSEAVGGRSASSRGSEEGG
jgi:protein-L-isoaspartate(D-aspartate) O-methyltransferase